MDRESEVHKQGQHKPQTTVGGVPLDGGSPVPVDVGRTEGKAVVKEGGVDHGAVFRPFQQVSEVAEMSVAPSDSISGTILI